MKKCKRNQTKQTIGNPTKSHVSVRSSGLEFYYQLLGQSRLFYCDHNAMLNRNWCQIEADVTRGHSVEQVKYFWWRLVNFYQVSQQPLELVLVWYEMVTSDRRALFRSRIHLVRNFYYLSLSPNEHANKWKWNNGRREGDGQTVAFMIIDFSVSSLIFSSNSCTRGQV